MQYSVGVLWVGGFPLFDSLHHGLGVPGLLRVDQKDPEVVGRVQWLLALAVRVGEKPPERTHAVVDACKKIKMET